MKHSKLAAGVYGSIAAITFWGLGLAPAHAQAQAFPTRTVKLIVSTTAGGGGDVLARAIADKLSALWGQSVIVEQRTGANGMIATAALVKAPADGYTAFMSLSALVQNLLLRPNPGYKLNELAPVSMVSINPMAFVVGAGVPARTVSELVSHARQNPDKVSYGTFGTGSSAHIIGAGLSRAARVNWVHVPYKGEAASFADLVSGQLTSNFGTAGFYGPHAATGKVRMLAVTSPHRLKRFPDVPTLAEAGYPDSNLAGWFGIFLPAATPKAVVQKFEEGVRKVVAMPDVQSKIYDMGLEPVGGSAEDLAKAIDADMKLWSKVIKDTGIKLD